MLKHKQIRIFHSKEFLKKCVVDSILIVGFAVTAFTAPSALGKVSDNSLNQPPNSTKNGKMIFRPNPVEERRDNAYSAIAYEASMLLKEGKLDEAQRKFEALPKTFDQGFGYLKAREGLAEIYTRRGQWIKAISEYEKRFDFGPNNKTTNGKEVEMRCKFALVLCNTGQFDRARASYTIGLSTLRLMVNQDGVMQPYLPLPPKADTFKDRQDLVPIMAHLLLAAYHLTNGDKKKVESEAALGSEAGSDNRLAHLYTGLALADMSPDCKSQARRELEIATSGDADPIIKKAAEKTMARLNQK